MFSGRIQHAIAHLYTNHTDGTTTEHGPNVSVIYGTAGGNSKERIIYRTPHGRKSQEMKHAVNHCQPRTAHAGLGLGFGRRVS